MSTGSQRRVTILGTMTHYLTAFVVLLKGIDKLTVPGKAGYAIILIIIGLVIVLGTIFHNRFEKILKHFNGIIAMLEAITMTIVGYLYLKDGKEFVQYACFFAAAMFLIASIIHFTKSKSAAPNH